MDIKRYNELMRNEDLKLSKSEIKDGWHFCYEWDELLIGPGMGEMEYCTCSDVDKTLHRKMVASQKSNKSLLTTVSEDDIVF
jgi:hypothetical protein